MNRALYDMLLLATAAHHGQIRKGIPEPYILHCMRVSRDAHLLHMPFVAVVAGLGHDLLEDTAVTEAQLQEYCTPTVFGLIKLLTKTWKDGAPEGPQLKPAYYAAILENPVATWLKIIDRTDNLRDMLRMITPATCPVSMRKWAARYALKTETEFAPLIAAAVRVDCRGIADVPYEETPVPAYLQALNTLKTTLVAS